MDVRVLGPVEASVDERPVAIRAGKPRALLALLALNVGSAVSAERLIDGLWGEKPPATAAKMVQVYVSQLRKALAAGGDGAEILTRAHGYELRLGPGEVDVRRFERLVAAGAPREALTLWRGAALHDLADAPFAAVEIRRLEELRLAALELAIDGDLAAGRHREVIGELEALVAEEPLREHLHAQRMLALYRCGRQGDALDAYGRARAALVEAIGVEPGTELRRLQEAVLRQDPSLELPEDEVAGLPPELDAGTPLIGREAELVALREHWRHVRAGTGRIVVIMAGRGMGKTRLAAELAAEVHRGRGAVRYASGAGAPEAARAALTDATSARRPTLLVLDDADQAPDDVRTALDDVARVVADLPVLVLATVEHDGLAACDRLELGPLDAVAVRAVALLYAGPNPGAEPPVEQLVGESGGVPRRVHRAAAEWARGQAGQRLGATAERAAAERTGLRATEDDLAGDVVALQVVRELAELHDDRPGVVACPFKGLAFFDVEDADVFFGRERLVAEMVARLAGAPLMGVVGPSGSGKSSALRAGLLASLAAGVLPGSEDWALALLRPGGHPMAALERAIAAAPTGVRMIVAVDQFEEAFTACADESERTAFIDALVADAQDPRRRALVLIAVRADFYGRCAAYPELARLLGANHALVGPLRRNELRRAVELPARRAGLRAEPDLVDALIADIEGEPGALPLLSTSLLELWQQRDGRRLRLSAYEQAGGVHGAVARLAERAYERLDPQRRELARRVMLRLAGEGETGLVVRRRVPLDELRGEGITDVLDVLADDRLVTIGEGQVEVAHEALLREWPRLRGWLEDDAQGRRLHHQLRSAARDWNAGGRDPGELYRGARLAAALDWSATHDAELTTTERAFLDNSRAAGERSQRRMRAELAAVAALLVLALIAGVIALEQRGTARAEATAADAQRLGTRALVESDLDTSLLLARQGVKLDDSVQTRGNLLAALVKSPAAIGVLRGKGERMWSLALSPDGRTLAAGDPIGNVYLFDTSTRRLLATLTPWDVNAWVVSLAFSPDGRRLAIAHDTDRGNLVSILDIRSRRVLRTLKPRPYHFVTGLRYADAGTLDTMAITSDADHGPALFTRFDARTGRRLVGPIPVDRRGGSPLLATSDGTRLITAGDGAVTVRDASTLRPIERFPVGGAAAPPSAGAYALSPDDHTVAIGGQDGSVRLLDLRTGALRRASGRHAGAVQAAQFTPDGRNLVTAGDDRDAIVWDVKHGAQAETLSGHANGVQSLQVTHDGTTLYTASLDGTVFIWDLLGRRRLGRPFKAGAGDSTRPQLALSPDGRLIAMGQDDGAISIVDARTLAPRAPFPVVDTGQVVGIGFVPGSRLLVVGGPRGFLALVDADSGRVIRRLVGHRGRIWTPGISADGRLLATGSDDDIVRLWSLPDGNPLGRPLRFRRDVSSVRLSPDGRRLFIALVDADTAHTTIQVWDTRSRRRVRSVRVTGWADVDISPDGRLLALGYRTGGAQLWSTATWRPVGRNFAADAGGIESAQISRDDRALATTTETGVVRLWDIKTGQAIGTALPGVPSRPAVAYFTARGHLIASYDTGRAYLWDIRPGSLARHACEVAGRRLTRTEWDEFLPGRDYNPAC
jgi:WD40 repeat protein/DNA-binding SARP family transcriptional activator